MTKENNIRAILETNFAGFREDIIESAVKMIMGLEARHGQWIDCGLYSSHLLHHEWECSSCHGHVIDIGRPWYVYCPNCGAKMRNEEDKSL